MLIRSRPRAAIAIRGWLLPLAVAAAGTLRAGASAAETTLVVDLAAPLGPATHVASGSLYGVTESLPADVAGLLAPLRPRMFVNPAANVQQPVGDAISVAARVASTGATVTIRLADWLRGFYTFTTMPDWLDKVGQTVSRRKAANLTNIYAYEIFNEPNITYAASNPLSFNEFWRQTFVRLRELDPAVKITGPSTAYYDATFLRSFLSFCKANGCLPDIIGWHELGGGDFTSTMQAYRALETELGIGPLPVTINEYSGAAHLDVEGQPGASAPLIAKFERLRVDSACISYWDVPHPGRLGSLLATNTAPNGGWWFYKWYGDMGGNMVSTTPPTPASATALDGFANLDSVQRTASVLFGGGNDGSIRVVVEGIRAAPFFGSRVRALVERAPFVDRATPVASVEGVTEAELDVADDRISVLVPAANAKDGYRLLLTPVAQSAPGDAPDASSTGEADGSPDASSNDAGRTGMTPPEATPRSGGNSSGGTEAAGPAGLRADSGGASGPAAEPAATVDGVVTHRHDAGCSYVMDGRRGQPTAAAAWLALLLLARSVRRRSVSD